MDTTSLIGITNLATIGNDIVLYILLFLGFIRIIFIMRVVKDSAHRTDSLFFQIVSILMVTALTPIIGLPLYLAIRPARYKCDTIPYREASASTLSQCDNCQVLNPKEYEFCVGCGHKIQVTCKECKKLIPYAYKYCNMCGAPNIE